MMDTSPIILEEDDFHPKTCSGVLQCGALLNEPQHKKGKNKFIGSLFFQVILVYCSCIYYRRIMDGLEYLRDNIHIIIRIWYIFMKCIAYAILLALTIGFIIKAMEDEEKNTKLLEVMAFISFLDYFDDRENQGEEGNEEENEEEDYRRWRRRRGDY